MTEVINPDGSPAGTIPNPDPKSYFILETQTLDWQYIVQTLIVAKKSDDPKDAFVRVFPDPSAHPLFYLSREKFTADEIAKMIGYKGDMKVFEDVEIIHLKPIGDQSKWQKPTVDYMGSA